MAAGIGSKRRNRVSHASASRSTRVNVAHDWEKDDEELELEAKLFGTSKKRLKRAREIVHGPHESGETQEVEGLGEDEVCERSRNGGGSS